MINNLPDDVLDLVASVGKDVYYLMMLAYSHFARRNVNKSTFWAKKFGIEVEEYSHLKIYSWSLGNSRERFSTRTISVTPDYTLERRRLGLCESIHKKMYHEGRVSTCEIFVKDVSGIKLRINASRSDGAIILMIKPNVRTIELRDLCSTLPNPNSLSKYLPEFKGEETKEELFWKVVGWKK